MQQTQVIQGSRMVIITEDMGRFSARLYVDHGDIASCHTAWRGKTMAGAQRWAKKVLAA
jgi:hypothetical protein